MEKGSKGNRVKSVVGGVIACLLGGFLLWASYESYNALEYGERTEVNVISTQERTSGKSTHRYATIEWNGMVKKVQCDGKTEAGDRITVVRMNEKVRVCELRDLESDCAWSMIILEAVMFCFGVALIWSGVFGEDK